VCFAFKGLSRHYCLPTRRPQTRDRPGDRRKKRKEKREGRGRGGKIESNFHLVVPSIRKVDRFLPRIVHINSLRSARRRRKRKKGRKGWLTVPSSALLSWPLSSSSRNLPGSGTTVKAGRGKREKEKKKEKGKKGRFRTKTSDCHSRGRNLLATVSNASAPGEGWLEEKKKERKEGRACTPIKSSSHRPGEGSPYKL